MHRFATCIFAFYILLSSMVTDGSSQSLHRLRADSLVIEFASLTRFEAGDSLTVGGYVQTIPDSEVNVEFRTSSIPNASEEGVFWGGTSVVTNEMGFASFLYRQAVDETSFQAPRQFQVEPDSCHGVGEVEMKLTYLGQRQFQAKIRPTDGIFAKPGVAKIELLAFLPNYIPDIGPILESVNYESGDSEVTLYFNIHPQLYQVTIVGAVFPTTDGEPYRHQSGKTEIMQITDDQAIFQQGWLNTLVTCLEVQTSEDSCFLAIRKAVSGPFFGNGCARIEKVGSGIIDPALIDGDLGFNAGDWEIPLRLYWDDMEISAIHPTALRALVYPFFSDTASCHPESYDWGGHQSGLITINPIQYISASVDTMISNFSPIEATLPPDLAQIPSIWQPNRPSDPNQDGFPYINLSDYVTVFDGTPIDSLSWSIVPKNSNSIITPEIHSDRTISFEAPPIFEVITDTMIVSVTDWSGLSAYMELTVNLYPPNDSPKSLYLVHPNGFSSRETLVDSLLSKLYQTAYKLDAYPGLVLDVGKLASLEFESWEQNRTDINLANNVVEMIKQGLNPFLPDNMLEHDFYITLIGPDAVIPHFAMENTVNFPDSAVYAPLVDGSTHLGAAILQNYMLTDNYYGIPVGGWPQLDDPYFPLPAFAVGRLVEKPDDIYTYLDRYLTNVAEWPNGQVRVDSALVFAYGEALEDCGTAISDTLARSIPTVSFTVTPGTETIDQLESADVFFPLSHSLHFEMELADAQTFQAADLVGVDLSGKFIYTPACYFGYNAGSEAIEPLDFAEVILRQGTAGLVANLGAGFAMSDEIGYHETLVIELTNLLLDLNPGIESPPELGQILTLAKHAYFQTRIGRPGCAVVGPTNLDEIDEKLLLGTVFYGLPMTKIDRNNLQLREPVRSRQEIIIADFTYQKKMKDANGGYYFEANENNVSLDAGYNRTLQPIYFPLVPQPGTFFKGYMLRSGAYIDFLNLPPDSMYHGIAWSNGDLPEPLYIYTDDWEPIPGVSLGLLSRATFPLGRYSMERAFQRVMTHVELKPLTGSPNDLSNPEVVEIIVDPHVMDITFQITATDEAGIDSMFVMITELETDSASDSARVGTWSQHPLNVSMDESGNYLGECTLPFTNSIEYYFQILDMNQNLTVAQDSCGYNYELIKSEAPSFVIEDLPVFQAEIGMDSLSFDLENLVIDPNDAWDSLTVEVDNVSPAYADQIDSMGGTIAAILEGSVVRVYAETDSTITQILRITVADNDGNNASQDFLITFRQKNDVTGDGSVGIKDIIVTINAFDLIQGHSTVTDFQIGLADVSGDSVVDLNDVIQVIGQILDLE